MSNTIKLLPCLCGAEAAYHEWYPSVMCSDAGCGWNVEAKSRAAAEMWNKREGHPICQLCGERHAPSTSPCLVNWPPPIRANMEPDPDHHEAVAKREEFAFWEKAFIQAIQNNTARIAYTRAEDAVRFWTGKKKEIGL